MYAKFIPSGVLNQRGYEMCAMCLFSVRTHDALHNCFNLYSPFPSYDDIIGSIEEFEHLYFEHFQLKVKFDHGFL